MKQFGFGTMRLPTTEDGAIDQAQVCEMIDQFLARGYTYFDTAYPYHKGKAELAVRECLVKRHPRDAFLLADKLPPWNIRTESDLEPIFQKQLNKCGVTYFDYYLLHNLSADNAVVFDNCNAFEFLKKVKADGRAKQVGFSFHDKPELLEQLLAERGVCHFAAAETHGYFDPVAIVQELLGVFDFGIEVVGVDARGHANLLDLDDLLVLLGFFFFLQLLETVLAVVHDLADRRNGVRRDLDKVKVLLLGKRQGVGRGHNTKLAAVSSDHAKLLVADLLVDLMF